MYKFMVRASAFAYCALLTIALSRPCFDHSFHFSEIRKSEDGRRVLRESLKSADLRIDRMAID